MIRFVLFCSILLSGCMTQARGSSTGEPENILYTYKDDRENSKILLTYENDKSVQMCLSPNNWPNSAGKINQAASRVILEIDGRAFPLEDFNTGYCANCSIRVKPQEMITGVLSYQDFGIPVDLYNSSKVLRFQPRAYPCN